MEIRKKEFWDDFQTKSKIREVSRQILFQEDPIQIKNALLCAIYALEEIATCNVPQGCAAFVAEEAFDKIGWYSKEEEETTNG